MMIDAIVLSYFAQQVTVSHKIYEILVCRPFLNQPVSLLSSYHILVSKKYHFRPQSTQWESRRQGQSSLAHTQSPLQGRLINLNIQICKKITVEFPMAMLPNQLKQVIRILHRSSYNPHLQLTSLYYIGCPSVNVIKTYRIDMHDERN